MHGGRHNNDPPFYSQGLFERISDSGMPLMIEERNSDSSEWTKVEDGGWISPSIWQSQANSIQFSSMFDVSTSIHCFYFKCSSS